MKLSDLDPEDIESIPTAGLKLSSLSPEDVAPEMPATAGPSASTSPVTAGATGILNGMTMNFAPAIGAAGKTAMDAITGVSGPLGGGDIDELVDEYRNQRDRLKHSFAKAAAAHPAISMAGQIAGGAGALGLAGPAATTPAGIAASGGAAGAGESVSSGADLPTTIKNTAMGAGTALGTAGLMGAAGAGLGKIGQGLGSTAENLAESATGATGKEAAEFAPGAGRQLLDRKWVGFGDSPGDIAIKANQAMQESGAGITNSLSTLDQQGAVVDRNTVLNYIREKMANLSGREGKADFVRSLQDKMGDIEAQVPETSADVPLENAAESASSEMPISLAEQAKRDFQDKVNWKSADVENDANAAISDAYKTSVEEAATKANPELAAQFQADKATYGLAKPIAAAAARRAGVLSQHPILGLNDMVAAHFGGLPAVMARRALAPRMASMGAVTADRLSQVLTSNPAAFGKFSGVLQSAAARGGVSLGATDYILQQTNQEYRTQKNQVFSTSQDDEQEELP